MAIETVYATGKYISWRNSWTDFENRTSNVVIDGTNYGGRIYNYASNVTINGGSGEIWNYGEDDGGTNVIINVSSGSGSIANYCSYSTITCSSPDKTTISNNYAENVVIISGAGDDSIWNSGSNVSIFGGAGNNTIKNSGDYVTISTGDGNNSIKNYEGYNVILNGGSGNDVIENTGSTVTIDGGGGNDKIYNGAAPMGDKYARYYMEDSYEGSFSNVVFRYKVGDGNHTIWGFRENSTLEVEGVELADISYSPDAYGLDFNVTIGNAQVSLPFSGPNGAYYVPNLNIAVVKSYSLICDVERNILDDLLCDVERSVSSEINLFKTNTDDIFTAATSEPVTISADITPDVSANTNGLQSFTIQIAEQQLTDQVTFTGIIPFNIMEYIEGQYFDYKYKMRIESVTQSGILFTCHCCSNVDELLYELWGYEKPEVDDKYTEWHDANISTGQTNSDDDDESEESYPYADEHLWEISGMLNLEPICQFNNFYSTVDITVAGVTCRDLIRSIFGWTARIPPHMINVFIRDDKLYAIQRGHEEHVIDISNAKITQPVFTRELVRTFWGETPYIKTEVRTVPTYTTTPIYEGIDKAKVQPLASDTRQDSNGTTTINYSYDADGMLIKTEEISPTSRTVTTHTYITGANGNKFLSKEETTVYNLDGEQIDYRSVKHSPTNYGQAAVTAGNGDSQNIVSTVKNVPYDERPTPYAIGQQLKALITEPSGSKRQERLVPGIVSFDTSFPVVGDGTLLNITAAIKSLNRTTQETVTLSLYDFPHVIDFNDRILINGAEFFLKSNKVSTSPRVFHQQNLTLVRWIGYPAYMYERL